MPQSSPETTVKVALLLIVGGMAAVAFYLYARPATPSYTPQSSAFTDLRGNDHPKLPTKKISGAANSGYEEFGFRNERAPSADFSFQEPPPAGGLKENRHADAKGIYQKGYTRGMKGLSHSGPLIPNHSGPVVRGFSQ